jgi:peptidoglycan/LPS O-acetylase OafA/YrhL
VKGASIGTTRGRTFFPEAESLRGIAILLVFFYHANGLLTGGGAKLGSPLMAFVRSGNVGVDLFFVLSGFLLSGPFLAVAEGGPPVSVRRYFARRALRILPMYLVAVAVAAVAVAQRPADLLHGVPYLVFLNSFPDLCTPLLPFSIPWWSLAAEVQFYAVLPLLGYFLGSPRRRWLGLGVLAAAEAARVAIARGWLVVPELRLAFPGRAPVFAIGILAAWVHRRWGTVIAARLGASPAARQGGADAALVASFAVLAYLLRWVTFLGPAAEIGTAHLWHAAAAALWAGVLLLLLLAPLRSKPLFANPVLGAVGLVSYSLFLNHLGPLQRTLVHFHGAQGPTSDGWTLHSTLTVLAVLAACIALSAATYRFIERPFLARKARLG